MFPFFLYDYIIAFIWEFYRDLVTKMRIILILKCSSRESREGIRIRDRISISYNNGRVFAFGEDSLALRLASELADLRAANADRRRLRGSVRIVAPQPTEKPPLMEWLIFFIISYNKLVDMISVFLPTNRPLFSCICNSARAHHFAFSIYSLIFG